MAVVAVFNQKGGVGKTTTCLNLVAALAAAGRKPLVLDLDPQAHLTLAWGIKGLAPEETVSAFYRQDKPLASLVRELPDGGRLIPSHMELSKIDALFGKSASITSKLRQGIQAEFSGDPAPVLIDCCPMLGVLSLNAVFAADRVLIPVSADFLSMQGVHRLDAALRVLEGPLKRKVAQRIVLTRFDARRRLSFEVFDRLKDRYGDDLCDTRIGENVALAESPLHGKDVFHFAPSSQGAKDYKALTDELTAKGFFS